MRYAVIAKGLTLERVEAEVKKAKERSSDTFPPFFDRTPENEYWALKEVGVSMTARGLC